MSRSILIQVTYMNNRKMSRGIANGKNAEYKKSKLSVIDLNRCLKEVTEEVGDKKIKEVEVLHHISTSFGIVERVKHYYPNLGFVWPEKLIRINTLLFQPYRK